MSDRFVYIRNLIVIFICWKIYLLVIAVCSPGPGYDTSSSLSDHNGTKKLPYFVHFMTQKLTRWDAIYFINISRRGYIFEQEWAFGWGMTQLIALCTAGLKKILALEGLESVVGILIAHTSHFLSVIILFFLTSNLVTGEGKEFAFSSACLHIISPAGIFLSVPYAESSCALFSFAGLLFFAKSFTSGILKRDILILMSGLAFGISTTLRSNAILNGFLFLEEALISLWSLRNNFQRNMVCHLLTTGVAGLFVASGLLIPQYIAYNEFCRQNIADRRPWCSKYFPSIYTFVQSHYWSVGLFNYWKVSNLPLFVISLPFYFVMFASGIWAVTISTTKNFSSGKFIRDDESCDVSYRILRNMAISQLMLTFGTLTTAHVQIITRISSSYPVWIWFLTFLLRDQKFSQFKGLKRFMVMYAVIQAGLYSSFLPPA